MKVFLITLGPGGEYSRPDSVGVRILSNCLKKEGCKVELLFLPVDAYKSIDKFSDRELDDIIRLVGEADLIGISLMTDCFIAAVKVTQAIKNNLRTPIIWGGIHPTIRPEESLEYADMVCVGEGEETLVELVKKLENRQDITDIQGLWIKHDGKIVKNELRPLINDLDSIPFPDYDTNDNYILEKRYIRKLDADVLKNNWLFSKHESCYLTLTSRGCPFECTYCWNPYFHELYPEQKKIRKRSIDNVIEELTIIKNRFPYVNLILIADDSFLSRTEEEISDFVKKHKKNIKIPLAIGGISPSTITKTKMSILFDTDVQMVRMGIQTGSERIKKLYRRYDSNEQIKKAANIINEFKDKIQLTAYDVILDNPWEKDEDIIKTLMFLTTLPAPYILNLFRLTLYPATDLYTKAKKENIIKDDFKDVYIRPLYFQTNYLNMLFFLLNSYASKGRMISPKTMSFLTNKRLRLIGLSQILFLILLVSVNGFNFVIKKSVKSISRKGLSRIKTFIRYKNFC